MVSHLGIEGEKDFAGERVGGVDHGAMLAVIWKFSMETGESSRKAAESQRKR
jgi:hypothetical protein